MTPSLDKGPVNVPLGAFPATAPSNLSPTEVDALAQDIVNRFDEALAIGDFTSVAVLFFTNGYWRDHLCLSWDLATTKGQDGIAAFLKKHDHRALRVDIDGSSDVRRPTACALDGLGNSHGIQFFTTLDLEFGRGRGIVRLAETEGEWKILTFFTSLLELKGHEEPVHGRRSKGVEHGGRPDRKNWQEIREADAEFQGKDPAVLIIGAGQGGLTAAARLKMLQVDTLVIDQNDRIGDNWRQRYHQLVLHDPVWFDHMPYVSFPPHWPVFTPKDKLAEFFEAYANLLELNVWTRTTLTSPSWDGRQWTVILERRNPGNSISTRTVRPRQIIQATGHSGEKYIPTLPGLNSFKGDRLCHSSDFKGALHANKGKRAVVRGGGYYIDVGASQLIIDGHIKIKQGVEISQVLADGLRFADGTELEADEIVLATGYQNMRTQTRRLFGDETADSVDDVWGFDQKSEMRGIWRPSGHRGLWFMGGNLAISRYYSRILALQIKAAEAGL
ncbi:hypothetical protein BDW62DRAFT_197331 [Aspergillus aurantiobrunneus]